MKMRGGRMGKSHEYLKQLFARDIYYGGTKLLPVEATILGRKSFAFLLRLSGIC